MRGFPKNQIGLIAAAIWLAAAICAVLVTGTLTIGRIIHSIRSAWGLFEENRSEKARVIPALRRELGYGGMIHEFKNFVVRHDGFRTKAVEEKLAAAFAAVERYAALGPGIPAKVLPQVLEALFSTKTFGTGLGLATVRQIMEAHGGGLEITSREHCGTKVVLWRPLGQPRDEGAPA